MFVKGNSNAKCSPATVNKITQNATSASKCHLHVAAVL